MHLMQRTDRLTPVHASSSELSGVLDAPPERENSEKTSVWPGTTPVNEAAGDDQSDCLTFLFYSIFRVVNKPGSLNFTTVEQS